MIYQLLGRHNCVKDVDGSNMYLFYVTYFGTGENHLSLSSRIIRIDTWLRFGINSLNASQVCIIADSVGGLFAYDLLTVTAPEIKRRTSHGSYRRGSSLSPHEVILNLGLPNWISRIIDFWLFFIYLIIFLSWIFAIGRGTPHSFASQTMEFYIFFPSPLLLLYYLFWIFAIVGEPFFIQLIIAKYCCLFFILFIFSFISNYCVFLFCFIFNFCICVFKCHSIFWHRNRRIVWLTLQNSNVIFFLNFNFRNRKTKTVSHTAAHHEILIFML